MRHLLTQQERSKGGRNSPTKFKAGPDPRRHKLTRDEQSKGGWASWWRTVADVRTQLGLPLFNEHVIEYARRLVLARLSSFDGLQKVDLPNG